MWNLFVLFNFMMIIQKYIYIHILSLLLQSYEKFVEFVRATRIKTDSLSYESYVALAIFIFTQ